MTKSSSCPVMMYYEMVIQLGYAQKWRIKQYVKAEPAIIQLFYKGIYKLSRYRFRKLIKQSSTRLDKSCPRSKVRKA